MEQCKAPIPKVLNFLMLLMSLRKHFYILRNLATKGLYNCIRQGILAKGEGSVSTVNLLIKVACFLSSANNIFNMKMS